MTAELIKIYPAKLSKHGNVYKRLAFMLSNGKWAKTDLCPDHRNYRNWHYIMKFGPGTKIKDFKMKDELTIDADSNPIILPEDN